MRSSFVSVGILTLLLASFVSGQDFQSSLRQYQGGGDVTAKPPSGKAVFALEEPIDPATYILGPGDQLEVAVFGTFEVRIPVDVSPDGIIIVNTIGAFKVDTLSLKQVDDLIREKGLKVYPRATILTRMTNLRTMMVNISGQVVNPGTFGLSAMSRLSALIVLAGGFYIEESPMTVATATPGVPTPDRIGDKYDGETTLPMGRKWFMDDSDPQRITPSILSEKEVTLSPSYRMITVTSREGKTHRYDYQKFLNIGDKNQNPILRDGDMVFIPATDLRRSSLYISGAVKLPGKYDFVDGDRLMDLVEIAGGFQFGALTNDIMILRTSIVNGARTCEELTVYLEDTTARGPVLQAQDQIYIRSDYDYKGMARVQLLGEVKYPGIYPILEDKTTLYSLIKQAGLFTEKADLTKARVIRWAIASQHDPEYYQLKLFDVPNMDQTEISYLKLKNRFDPPVLNVDFVKLFDGNDMAKDVILQDGDQIEIPVKSQTINVIGFVKHPGIVNFKAGEDYSYYVELAGGYAFRARTGAVRLIKGNSMKWEKVSGSTVIEPGDTLFIPEKDEFDAWQFFKDSLLVISQVTTILLVVRNLQ